MIKLIRTSKYAIFFLNIENKLFCHRKYYSNNLYSSKMKLSNTFILDIHVGT